LAESIAIHAAFLSPRFCALDDFLGHPQPKSDYTAR
jgi:hypothetical protein